MSLPEFPSPVSPWADPAGPPGPPPFWAYTPPAPPPPPRPRWRRLRRVCVVAAVVGLLVAASAAAVAVQTFRDASTPEAAVRVYFAALSSGDAATALAAGTVPGGGRALVSDDVLRATLALSPIDAVTTGAVSRNGDSATVEVRYRLGGASPAQVDDAVDVHRVDGRWRLVRSAVPVSLGVDAAATWAAVPATTPFALPTGAVQLVFPGAAPVIYRSPLLQVTTTSRIVRLATADAALRISAQPTEAGRGQITSAVVAALTACVKGGEDVDPYCPQPAPGRSGTTVLRSVPNSFTGDLQGLDRLELQISVAPGSAGSFVVSGSVDASGSWQVLDYDNVARNRTGPTAIPFDATVPVGAAKSVVWDRA